MVLETKKIPASWQKILDLEFQKPYFKELAAFIEKEQATKTIFPQENNIFAALKYTAFAKVKVIILGQDPYHGENQANGLAFSVNSGMKLPPSLKNIFKELNNDVGCEISSNGDLAKWAKQGVLLLNTALTVNKGEPSSHKGYGWENFTDRIIEELSNKKKRIVFILWGNHAKEKQKLIDEKKHLVLSAAHPSPFSAYNGFFGCRHFSRTNEFLIENKATPIDWSL